jgi:hypothetical protein
MPEHWVQPSTSAPAAETRAHVKLFGTTPASRPADRPRLFVRRTLRARPAGPG